MRDRVDVRDQFREAIGKVTSKPLSILIDTHCHLDHTHGDVVFEDLPILAHEKCLAAATAWC